MKKVFTLVISCLVFALAAGPVSAAYVYTGLLTEDLIMSEPLARGQMDFSGGIQYFTASEISSIIASGPGTDPKWEPLGDVDVTTLTQMVIPLVFAYGITDDIAVRVTAPYVSYNQAFEESSGMEDVIGSGIGDLRIEGLYRIIREDENMPSITGNLGIKFATGTYDKDFISVAFDEPWIGTGANDVILSAIVAKQLGPVVGKVLLGYVLTDAVFYDGPSSTTVVISPAERTVYSVACIYPMDSQLEFGGEIWGMAGGKDTFTISGYSMTIPDSEISAIFLSPYVAFKPMEELEIRGRIEVPLSQQPTYSLSDGMQNGIKGTNISVGGTWSM